MPTATALKFRAFQKVWIDNERVLRTIDSRSLRGMQRVGAVLRRAARKKIKRRGVTTKMWDRLSAARANARKTHAKRDQRRVDRIMASIQRRQNTSSPAGQPPFAHVPDHPVNSIRAIYFAAFRDRVIVGPVKANQTHLAGSNRATVPELLEFGGVAAVNEVSHDQGKTWIRKHGRRKVRPWQKHRIRKARYGKRKFMNPTLVENADKTAQIIATALRA